MPTRVSLVFLAFVLVAMPSGADGQEALRTDLRSLLDHWGSAGAVVTVVRDSEVILYEGFGTTKPGGDQPVTTETVATVASVTKTFGGLAVALLVAEGKLRWDDLLIDHIPEFSFGGAAHTAEVTLKDLVTHRAGIPNVIGGLWNQEITVDDFLRDLPNEDPVVAVRDRLEYSQVGVSILGEVVARASGLSWPEFVRVRILEPLGMESTYVGTPEISARFPDPDAAPDLMGRLVRRDGQYTAGPWRGFGPAYSPAGGIATTARDMRAYIDFWLSGGGELLGREQVEELWRPVAIERSVFAPVVNPFTDLNGYGLGWYVYDFEGYRVVEHPGANAGSAVLALIPSAGVGVFIATNANFPLASERLVSAMKFAALSSALDLPSRDWVEVFTR